MTLQRARAACRAPEVRRSHAFSVAPRGAPAGRVQGQRHAEPARCRATRWRSGSDVTKSVKMVTAEHEAQRPAEHGALRAGRYWLQGQGPGPTQVLSLLPPHQWGWGGAHCRSQGKDVSGLPHPKISKP